MTSWKLYIYKIITGLMPETSCFSLKASLLRWCGAKIGQNVRICSSAMIMGVGNLKIGNDVWVGHRAFIMSGYPAKINIGSHVDIAPDVYISTGTHEIDRTGSHSAGRGLNKDITISDGVWLCARSVILPGVTVGEKSIVAAAAVVLKNVAARKVVCGVPAIEKGEV